jgi:hypothetical protein
VSAALIFQEDALAAEAVAAYFRSCRKALAEARNPARPQPKEQNKRTEKDRRK